MGVRSGHRDAWALLTTIRSFLMNLIVLWLLLNLRIISDQVILNPFPRFDLSISLILEVLTTQLLFEFVEDVIVLAGALERLNVFLILLFRLCRSRTERSPLFLGLLEDLLDVGGIFLEEGVMFHLLLVWGDWWLCSRLRREIPLDLGVLKLIFYLVNVNLSICTLVRANVDDGHRPLD